VKFKTVKISNFLSLADGSVEFTPGVHLISGRNYDMSTGGEESNGSGKSSIFDAIEWCLRGTIGREGFKADSAVNRVVGKDCKVSLDLEDMGKDFLINRHRKHTDKGNAVEWFLDGEEMRSHRKADTDKELGEALSVSANVFKYAVFVGQGMPNKFLDLSETQKQDLLCDVMNLSVYDDALALAKEATKSARAELQSARSVLEYKNSDIDRWTTQVDMYVEKLETFIENSGGSMEDATNQVVLHNAEIEGMLSQCADLERELADLRTNEKLLNEERITVQNATAQIDSELSGINAAKAVKLKELRKYEGLTDICPTCDQKVDADHIGSHIAAIQAEIEQYDAMVVDKMAARTAGSEMFNDYNNAISQVGAGINTNEKSIFAFRKAIKETQARSDALVSRLSVYEKEKAQLDSALEVANDTLVGAQNGLQEVTDKVVDLETQALHREYWEKIIPNLRAAAVGDILTYLNERLAYYMNIFSEGTMQMKLYQETYGKGSKIKVDLQTPGGTYGMSSGGEKRRVDLSLYLSLSDLVQTSLGTSTNLLVCDEILDGLSGAGADKFLNILRQKADEGTCVFVTTHNPAVLSRFRFDSQYLVEKRGGVAVLDRVE
jgi:DNA repair exonuclease SbcCD ATPase subunit